MFEKQMHECDMWQKSILIIQVKHELGLLFWDVVICVIYLGHTFPVNADK